jgi:hypothetical protein
MGMVRGMNAFTDFDVNAPAHGIEVRERSARPV